MPLAAYWALGMAPFGLTLPYWGLYLRENAGLSGAQVGMVFAVIPAVGIVVQPFWGVLADRSGLRARILLLLSLGAAAGPLAIETSRSSLVPPNRTAIFKPISVLSLADRSPSR